MADPAESDLVVGALQRRSIWQSNWRCYYYVLRGSALAEFTSAKLGDKPRKFFHLRDFELDQSDGRTFSLGLFESDCGPIFFRSADEGDNTRWVRALAKVCRPSTASWTDPSRAIERMNDPCLVVQPTNDGTVIRSANQAFLSIYGHSGRDSITDVSLGQLLVPLSARCVQVQSATGACFSRELTIGRIPCASSSSSSSSSSNSPFFLRLRSVDEDDEDSDFYLSSRLWSTSPLLAPSSASSSPFSSPLSSPLLSPLSSPFPSAPTMAPFNNTKPPSTPSASSSLASASASTFDFAAAAGELDLLFSRTAKDVGALVQQSLHDSLEGRFSELMCTIDGLRGELETRANPSNNPLTRRSPRRSTHLAVTPSSSITSSSSSSSSSLSLSAGSTNSSQPSLNAGRAGQNELVLLDTKRTEVGPVIYDGGTGTCVRSASVDGWQCIVKELQFSSIAAEVIERFESELATLESLPRHDNLVQYLFHRRTPSHLQVFTSRYDTTLARYIEDRIEFQQPFTCYEVTRFLLDIARGVEALHNNGIVHRDLKPDNIFITFDRENTVGRLVVGDFDSAKDVRAQGQAHSFVGTLAYMAPEVFGQQKEGDDSGGKGGKGGKGGGQSGGYGTACDIWSLGIMLYQLLTLQQLSTRGTFAAQTHLALHHAMFPASVHPLIDIFNECHQTTPMLRPTATLLLRRLQRCAIDKAAERRIRSASPAMHGFGIAPGGSSLVSLSMPSVSGVLSNPSLVAAGLGSFSLTSMELANPDLLRASSSSSPLLSSSSSSSSSSRRSRETSFVTIRCWELVEEMHRAASGIVYLVQHESTGQHAVMKIQQKDSAQLQKKKKKKDNNNKDRGGSAEPKPPREAEILKRLDHPGVVKLYDCFEFNRQWHLVMELVDGGNLAERIEEAAEENSDDDDNDDDSSSQVLPKEQVRTWFREIVEAVQHCHQHGIVHRDLTAENILIDDNDQVRITGFGLGNFAAADTLLHTICASGKDSPPEVLARISYRGQPLDIWAIGVVLFNMLTGECPWTEDHGLAALISADLFFIPENVAELPAQLLRSIFSINPDDRPTATDILNHPWLTQT